ncbi:Mor transcription activator family protein [Aeromonas salmonicida]|uniref:Mor transcription activator family protein n=1 Tax=Aeromonas salmonicida TaxID=645 RepID=UPI00267EE132
MEQNQDLFADDHASLGQLVDRLDQIPPSELTAKWPKALAELVDVLACELVRGGMAPDIARSQARKLALVQAHYMGGRAYYIPTGEHLKAALRDRAIWDEFNRPAGPQARAVGAADLRGGGGAAATDPAKASA